MALAKYPEHSRESSSLTYNNTHLHASSSLIRLDIYMSLRSSVQSLIGQKQTNQYQR